jgi:ATP-binding cassette subfamily B protein
MRVLPFIFHAGKPYKYYILGMIIAVLGVASFNNVQSYFMKLMVDSLVGANSYSIVQLAIWFALLQFSLVAFWALFDVCATHINPIRTDVTNMMLDKLNQYDISFFQNRMGGSLTSKIKDVTSNICTMINQSIDNFGNLSMIIIIAACVLLNVHYFFSISLILFVLLFFGIFYINAKTVNQLSANTAESEAQVFGQIGDYISNIFSVKYFVTTAFERRGLRTLQKEYLENTFRQGFFHVKLYVILGLVFSFYIIGCVAFLIFLYRKQMITPGDFAFVFAINYKIVDHLFFATHSLREFITHWGTMDQALAMLRVPVTIMDQADANTLKVERGEIVFDNVIFNYKGNEPLFQNKSVRIIPGQKVGLVGYSGGGKSTFVNLILRLFDVNAGKILIDGQDIQTVTQDSLRAAIGMIPQDPTLFHRSLMENIRYGRIDASDQEVIEAARKAHAHDFIVKVPSQYDALVGERGLKLSGGQRQRIAIARAILKNAPILILDEATSQLDSMTEKMIQQSLWELMQNKTSIVVAHRLSTLLHMDRILVFEQGKIIEDGTHQELLAKGGLYAQLWNAQVGGFLPDNTEEETQSV